MDLLVDFEQENFVRVLDKFSLVVENDRFAMETIIQLFGEEEQENKRRREEEKKNEEERINKTMSGETIVNKKKDTTHLSFF